PAFMAAWLLVCAGFGIWAAGTGLGAASLWFVRRRGLAMGLILSGVAAGGVLVPVWKAVVDAAGWRTAFVAAGVVLWLVSVPASLLLRHKPADLGLLPDGDPTPAIVESVANQESGPTPAPPISTDNSGPAKAQLPGERSEAAVVEPRPAREGWSRSDRGRSGADATLAMALRTRAFWTIALVSTLVLAGSTAAVVLMLPRLQDARLDSSLAVGAVTAVTLLGAVARLATGSLSDRVDPVRLAGATCVLQAIGLAAFAIAPQRLLVLAVFVLAFGLGSDNIRLLAAMIVARYYGPAAFGRIQGILYVVLLPGRVLGPVLAGALHDAGHGYGGAFVLFAALTLLMLLPLLTLRPPLAPFSPPTPPFPRSGRGKEGS
ncbi:MAG: MFS transporter, partial [Dehalococcoidia bacterium]